jgi:hypothetical protein
MRLTMLSAARPGQLFLRALRRTSTSTTTCLPSKSIAPVRWNQLARISPTASRTFHTTLIRRNTAAAEQFTIEDASTSSPPPPPAQQSGPVTQFSELAERGLVNENVVRAITQSMRIDTMTPVQSKTLNQTLSGIDT